MKLTYIWKKDRSKDVVEVISHPANEQRLKQMAATLEVAETIQVKDPITDRTEKIPLAEVEAIFALGHISKVLTISGKEYFLQKKLKELTDLEKGTCFRINNSTILNLKHVRSFSAGSYARLEVGTNTNNMYIVSRHYAKLIKGRLS